MFGVNVGAIRATVLALLAVGVVAPAETTQAQFLFWPRHGFWWSDHTTRRHDHRYRRTNPELAEKDEAQDAPNGPLQIIISIKDQRVSVYDNGALIGRSSVSTGIPRHPTPSACSVLSAKNDGTARISIAVPPCHICSGSRSPE
jgi:hypothetical protein